MTESRALVRKMRRAGLVLAWESFWRLAWPLPAWIALFLGISLIDILPLLPPFWHGVALLLFGLGAVLAALRLRHFRWPIIAEKQRRLETDSGLAHRPLSQLEDSPAEPDEIGGALWRLQRQRLLALLAKLRLRPPAPGLPARDPLGLRFAPLLLLAIGLAAGRHDIAGRLERALDPGWQSGNAPLAMQIWITPPSYTGQSPIMLTADPPAQTFRIPAGSKLLAELQGSERDARLFIDKRKLSFTRLDALSQRLEAEITEGSVMTLRLGRHAVAHWPIEVIADQPPEIAFAIPPAPLPDGKLHVKIAARDDYGVTGLALLLQRQDAGGGEDEIALPGAGQKELIDDMALDLTAHPWSGLQVALRPMAMDGAGHRTVGDTVIMQLPEREFRHPVARALIQLRRELVKNPDQRLPAVERLGVLAGQPALFHDDSIAFLQMVTARSRLLRDRGAAAVPSVLDMLWAAALRIEDGDLQNARDAVDQASQALAEALEKGASDAEITRLTAQLNEAMQKLISSLAKRGGNPPSSSSGGNGRVMTPAQLQAMLDQLSDLAHAGARQAAQQSLQALKNLLDQLQAGGQGGEADQQWQQGMDALQKLTEQQKDLLDRAFRRSQQQGSPNSGGKSEQRAQQSLRQQLQSLMQGLPDPNAAPALGQAQRAMQQAEQALQGEQTDAAVDAEGRALAKLQEGARQMSEAMDQAGSPASGGNQDPLGRAMSGRQMGDDGKVKIPAQSDLGKSREILDELRRRVGQTDRSPAERGYLRKLLDKLY